MYTTTLQGRREKAQNMLQGIVLSVHVCVHVYSRYLVDNVIPKVLGCQDKHSVEDVSGLFNQLLPPAVVVVLSLQPGNLWGIPQCGDV